MWQAQAKEIERSIAVGEVPESLREQLTNAKNDFVSKCRNVRIILGYAKTDGQEHVVMTMRYLNGKSMKQIARELGYSYGYCANVELNAISRMSKNTAIMQLIG